MVAWGNDSPRAAFSSPERSRDASGGLEERYRALRRRPKLRPELKAEREEAITRTERGNRTDLWVPRPPLDLDAHQPPGRLSAENDVRAGRWDRLTVSANSS